VLVKEKKVKAECHVLGACGLTLLIEAFFWQGLLNTGQNASMEYGINTDNL